jgi:hypothetical protein
MDHGVSEIGVLNQCPQIIAFDGALLAGKNSVPLTGMRLQGTLELPEYPYFTIVGSASEGGSGG